MGRPRDRELRRDLPGRTRGASAADASLRVLSFAVSLASGGRVSAVVFPPSDGGGSLDDDDPAAAHGRRRRSDVCLVRSAELFGYGPGRGPAARDSLRMATQRGRRRGDRPRQRGAGASGRHDGAGSGHELRGSGIFGARDLAVGAAAVGRERSGRCRAAASCALLTVASDALAPGSLAAASADSAVVDAVVGDGAVVPAPWRTAACRRGQRCAAHPGADSVGPAGAGDRVGAAELGCVARDRAGGGRWRTRCRRTRRVRCARGTRWTARRRGRGVPGCDQPGLASAPTTGGPDQ